MAVDFSRLVIGIMLQIHIISKKANRPLLVAVSISGATMRISWERNMKKSYVGNVGRWRSVKKERSLNDLGNACLFFDYLVSEGTVL